MRILILGGAGFVGPHIAGQLAALGHLVWLYHRGKGERRAESSPSIRHIYADLDSLRDFRDALRQLHFDTVIHMLAMTRDDARAAATVFNGFTGRLIIASSQDVYAAFGVLLKKETYSGDAPQRITESAPLRSARYIRGDDYEKIDVEQVFVHECDALPVTILRMPPTYGPEDPRSRFFPLVKRIDDGRPAILFEPSAGNFRWSHGYVENVAHAFVLAATRPEAANRIYNIGEARTPTQAERASAIARAVGYRGQIVMIPLELCPASLLRDVDFRHDLVIDDAAIRTELGYMEQVSFEEGYRRTVAWQRTRCPVPVDLGQFDYAAEDAALAAAGMPVGRVPGRA